FAMAHAAARDAVQAELDVAKLAQEVAGLGLPVLQLHSAAADRAAYLHRPELGRRLNEASRETVRETRGEFDVSIVIGDGLSAVAAQRHVAPLLSLLIPKLRDA